MGIHQPNSNYSIPQISISGECSRRLCHWREYKDRKAKCSVCWFASLLLYDLTDPLWFIDKYINYDMPPSYHVFVIYIPCHTCLSNCLPTFAGVALCLKMLADMSSIDETRHMAARWMKPPSWRTVDGVRSPTREYWLEGFNDYFITSLWADEVCFFPRCLSLTPGRQ